MIFHGVRELQHWQNLLVLRLLIDRYRHQLWSYCRFPRLFWVISSFSLFNFSNQINFTLGLLKVFCRSLSNTEPSSTSLVHNPSYHMVHFHQWGGIPTQIYISWGQPSLDPVSWRFRGLWVKKMNDSNAFVTLTFSLLRE